MVIRQFDTLICHSRSLHLGFLQMVYLTPQVFWLIVVFPNLIFVKKFV